MAVEEAAEETPEQPTSPTDASSLAQQSKIRSSSFRKGSESVPQGPLSPGSGGPEGSTAPEIYRKQVARIEELEKENERLAKNNTESEKKWKKAEGELEDLRESGDASGKTAGSGDEVEKLVRLHPVQFSRWMLTLPRNQRLLPFSDKTRSFNSRSPAPAPSLARSPPSQS